MSTALHAYGYTGEIERHVDVTDFYRATCDLCDWRSEEFDGLDWTGCEEAAIEHYEEEHADEDEGEL